jgi:hypothetical protein
MTVDDIRELCESSLFEYAKVMFPNRYFGDVHEELFNFFQKSLEYAMETGDGDNAGALVPRDHQKSFCIAVAVSWAITKYPWFTIAYVSSNPTLSERQLTIIKNVFNSDYHRELWPEMLNYEINPRTKQLEHRPLSSWTKTELSVDHKDRPKSEKDPTIFATSAKSTNTGAHFKLCVFDDLVTNENYRSAAEREEIREVYQSFASIATTGSLMWLVGTRYGDNDLYADLKEKTYTVFDDDTGEVVEERHLWKWFERVVEDSRTRDGSGNYVWPRAKGGDGNWYGFNATELSRKKSSAFNLELFYAQYYNDPNAADTDNVDARCFQYADPRHLKMEKGVWFYGNKQLRTHCGMDLAFTEGGIKKVRRDYTAISVIGWDEDGYLYVLEQKRFQTSDIEKYYNELMELWEYWRFKEVSIESNVGGSVVVNFIQNEVRKHTTNLVVKGIQSSKNKQERIELTLIPLYRNQSVFHFKGGYCKQLEEELRLTRPPHDDLKDSLYIAVANSPRQRKPSHSFKSSNRSSSVVQAGNRFHNRRRRA